MKIAVVGNLDNGGYRICKWMRQLGADAELFMFRMDANARSQPEAVDRGLVDENGGQYPPWMHWFEGHPTTWMFRGSTTAKTINEQFDIAFAAGGWGIAALEHLDLPTVIVAQGSEITEWPLAVWRLRAPIRRRIAGLVVRRGLRKAAAIANDFHPTIQTIDKLGFIDKMALWSWPEDVEGNQGRVDQDVLRSLSDQYGKYDQTYLWLSRLNFRDRNDSACKRSDLFLEAFRRSVHEDGRNVRAIIGAHGSDIAEFQDLVKQYRLEEYIDWAPHLPYWKLLTYLSLPNAVVFDEIGPAILGGLSREALSVGALVATTVDHQLIELSYGPGCPVMDVRDEIDCLRVMREIGSLSVDERSDRRSRTIDWARKYLHYEGSIRALLRIAQEAAFVHGVQHQRAA